MALDPVAMSYLLDGTGPVQVDGTTLTRDNVVDELLNKPYLRAGHGRPGRAVPQMPPRRSSRPPRSR